jgi:hypothetical protein
MMRPGIGGSQKPKGGRSALPSALTSPPAARSTGADRSGNGSDDITKSTVNGSVTSFTRGQVRVGGTVSATPVKDMVTAALARTPPLSVISWTGAGRDGEIERATGPMVLARGRNDGIARADAECTCDGRHCAAVDDHREGVSLPRSCNGRASPDRGFLAVFGRLR